MIYNKESLILSLLVIGPSAATKSMMFASHHFPAIVDQVGSTHVDSLEACGNYNKYVYYIPGA